VRIPGIISGSQFNGIDIVRSEAFENLGQRKARKQRSKNANSQDVSCRAAVIPPVFMAGFGMEPIP
jgi:hypothetical protein